jgi:hypothetical protein
MRCVEYTPWLSEDESKARTRQYRTKAEYDSSLRNIDCKQEDNYHGHSQQTLLGKTIQGTPFAACVMSNHAKRVFEVEQGLNLSKDSSPAFFSRLATLLSWWPCSKSTPCNKRLQPTLNYRCIHLPSMSQSQYESIKPAA